MIRNVITATLATDPSSRKALTKTVSQRARLGALAGGAIALLVFPSLATAGGHKHIRRVVGPDQHVPLVTVFAPTNAGENTEASICMQPATDPWLYAED
jgi:hypothetical protein